MSAGEQEGFVELRGLGKRYGEFTAVAGLDLAVKRGELFGLLGPNGAGKTTTLRMLMGILRASTGHARIDGLDCFTERVAVKRIVGYQPDEPIFHDYLRGREIVEFVGEMHGLSRADVTARAQPLFERLGLGDATEEYAVNYSHGMKKKLSFVCALLHEPRLLILDEPTNGLDPHATRSVHEIVQERVTGGATVLLSSHLLDQVEKLCSRIAIIARGRLAAVGTLAELRRYALEESSLEDVFFAVTDAARSEPPPPPPHGPT